MNIPISVPEIWIILGFVCILLEFVIPGALIVFFGVSAIIVGLLMKIFGLPMDNGIPFLIFVALTVGQIVFLRKRLKNWFTGDTLRGDESSLEEFVGKDATVVDGFAGGSEKGTVDFRGANWKAISDEPLETGTEVTITGREGITLMVTRKNARK